MKDKERIIRQYPHYFVSESEDLIDAEETKHNSNNKEKESNSKVSKEDSNTQEKEDPTEKENCKEKIFKKRSPRAFGRPGENNGFSKDFPF